MAKENSNKLPQFKDIISRSVQIRLGPPAIYQVTAKKHKFGTLTKMTVGEKNPNKTNKTILLVGESGAGKSKMINVLFNYTMGVKWEDEVWFQIVEEEEKSQAESQTSDVIVYEIFGFENKTLPYSLTIIDTPGYGSTRGIKHDDMVSEKLFDLFRSEDGVHEVHAVGLVIKGSDNRLNDRLMYIFDSMMSLFGKDLEKNIIAFITHSDGRKPKNVFQALEAANIKCAKNEMNQFVHFLFNNCQHEQRIEEEEEFLKHAKDISEKGIRELTAFLEKTVPQNLHKTKHVLNERIRLMACIQNLQQRIELTELKETEIAQIQEALKKHEEDMKNNTFTVEVDEVFKDKEPVDGKKSLFFYKAAVCCKVCEETCHNPCRRASRASKCMLMKEGRCLVCTSKCPASDHVKEEWIYVTKTRKVQRTLQDMKEKYEKNKTESEKELSLLKNLEKQMNQLTAEKSEFLDESYQHVVRLEQIALKADSASTIVHLDFLIEKMNESGETVKVQKLEEIRRRVDEGTSAAAQYMTANQKHVEEL